MVKFIKSKLGFHVAVSSSGYLVYPVSVAVELAELLTKETNCIITNANRIFEMFYVTFYCISILK